MRVVSTGGSGVLALFLIGAGSMLAACRDSGKEGEYFVLDGKIFVFNYRVATATYLVNIKPVKPVGEAKVAVVSFEDPAGGAPLVVYENIFPRNSRTTIHSPPLSCIVKDRPYKVSIRIENAAGAMMQQIETTVSSSQDQSMLPDKPLVVGPFYDPNPGDVEAPGAPPGGQKVACPA